MTVRELIAQLIECDPDAEVTLSITEELLRSNERDLATTNITGASDVDIRHVVITALF